MLQESPAETTAVSELPRPRLHRRTFARELIDTVVLIGAIYALVNLASVRFIVEGPSMQPNFETGQFLIVSRLNYLLGQPQRGDIIVFHPPGRPVDEPPYIKRVVGLPGDLVEIRDTHMYVNGEALNEPYINESCIPARCEDQSWQLGFDEYFVMGDNRNHSSDSRAFGVVKHDTIIGEAVVRYWPPQDWGIVSQIAFPGDSPR